MSLYESFLDNASDPISKCLHYFPIYERHFARFVNTPIVFLEIGSGAGGSSQMWRRYFGPLAKIVTVDVRPECLAFADHQVSVRIGDQSDAAFLESIIQDFGYPDIVLDDASRHMTQVNATFAYLYPRIARNGVYVVEDIAAAYWEGSGGGLGHENSFIERSKSLIDELNADHVRSGLAPTEFTRNTISIHFYDSVVVFERGQYVSKSSITTGDPSKKYR